MPFTGGIFNRVYSWVQQASVGVNILPNNMDLDTNDIANGLSQCVLRDGTGTPTADMPFGNNKLTGVEAGANAGEVLIFDQLPASNLLQNASFNVNQRNISSGGTIGLYHDRWKGSAAQITTITGGSFVQGYLFSASGMDTQVSYNAGALQQIIAAEDVVGGVYTLQHEGTAQARVYQGGTPPAFGATPITTAALTANTAITVEFSTGTILRPQLVTGSIVKPYTRRLPAIELLLCQRYYEQADFVATAAASGTVYALAPFKVAKKAVPSTVTFTVASATAAGAPAVALKTQNGITFTYAASGAGHTYGTVAVSCEP